MTNVIADHEDIARAHGVEDDPDAEVENIEATDAPTEAPMEFYVQMRGHTFRDMEALIVEAAAARFVGQYGPARLSKLIEERALSLLTAAIDKRLETVTAEIMNQPLRLNGRDVGTMADFIGLAGREFLTTPVDVNGKPTSGNYGAKPRIERLVDSAINGQFKNAVEKATNSAAAEIQKEMRARHEALLAAEKARLRAYIEKTAS